ncbi:MAG: phosphopantothenoylcysteine decarboxylase [Lentisphaeria bacterium]|nr:phosphopantothenoylcysteine decarboxylase [Lentisphaeria bacterium]
MKIVISAGPTRERIDAVRFLSNRSTGKMGFAIAGAAADMGYETVLVAGPVHLDTPDGVRRIDVESAADMAAAVKSEAADADVVIMAAAVADYRPRQQISGKMKKKEGDLILELERTEDILKSLGEVKRPGQILVGFAAETENLELYALDKLKRKNLDWIAANDVSRSDIGFGSNDNAVTLYGRNSERIQLPVAPKAEIAAKLLDTVLTKA